MSHLKKISYLGGDADGAAKDPITLAIGGECGLVLIFGLGGGGFICIALSVAARLSDKSVGDIDLGAERR